MLMTCIKNKKQVKCAISSTKQLWTDTHPHTENTLNVREAQHTNLNIALFLEFLKNQHAFDLFKVH